MFNKKFNVYIIIIMFSFFTKTMSDNSKTFFDFKINSINGNELDLSTFNGKTILLVNVASKCGFTKQYDDLQKLYDIYKDKGLVVIGVPSNQFGGQEPGSNEEIQSFCSLNFQTTFPVFGKINVNGEQADPLYKYLTEVQPGILGTKKIKWNFTKFLINKNGEVVKRFASSTKPKDISNSIEALIS